MHEHKEKQHSKSEPPQHSTKSAHGSHRQHNVSVRQNFNKETEERLNRLINFMFNGSYYCNSGSRFFERDDVALTGVAELFRNCRDRLISRAHDLMRYICIRGGRVTFDEIRLPEKCDWNNGTLSSLECLLQWKKRVQQEILDVHEVAVKNNDHHLAHMLEKEYLEPIIIFTRKLGVMISNLSKAGTGLGEYQFSKHLRLHMNEIMESTE